MRNRTDILPRLLIPSASLLAAVLVVGCGDTPDEANASSNSALDSQAPSAPANVHMTGGTATSVTLAWTASHDNVGVDGYSIYEESAGVASHWVAGASSPGVTISGLTAGVTYTFHVIAYDLARNYSASGNCTVTAGATQPNYTLAQTIADGATLNGLVYWAATPSNVAGTSRVEFTVDGALRTTEYITPYEFQGGGATGMLDATTLAGGAHTLTTTAFATSGATASAIAHVTVGGSGGTTNVPYKVRIVGNSRKIRPTETDQATMGSTSASVRGAGNEVLSFQVAVSGASTLTDVTVGSTLTNGANTIADANWTIYREEYATVTSKTTGQFSTVTATGRYPDALIPRYDRYIAGPRNAFPVSIPSGENRVAWIDVRVPAGQAAGVYTGALRVTADGASASVPVAVNVLNWTMPATASLMSHWGSGSDPYTVAGIADATNQQRIEYLYSVALLDNRASNRSPAVASAGSALFNQYVVPLMTGTASTLIPGAKNTVIAIQPNLNGSGVGASDISAYQASADANGYADRLETYQWDEPVSSQISAINSAINGALGVDSAIHTGGAIDGLWTSLAPGKNWIWTHADYMANTTNASPSAAATRSRRAEFDTWLASNSKNRIGLYTSHADSASYDSQGLPSFLIDALDFGTQTQSVGSPARAAAWICFIYNLNGGLLDWESSYHLATAWQAGGMSGGNFDQNGDGTLFYPGLPSQALPSGGTLGGAAYGPIESFRLKQHRNGFQDYEYLKYLNDHGQGASAMSIAQALFPTMVQTWVKDDVVQGQRAALETAVSNILP